MRFILIFCSFLISSTIISAQYKWYLEPTQDSDELITPMIKDMNVTIVKYDDYTSKVVDQSGKTVLERDFYNTPYSYHSWEKLFTISRNKEGYKFYDQNFNCVTEGFDAAKAQAEYNTLITTKNGLLGLIDYEGNVLIENKYKLLKRIRTGKFRAITEDDVEIELTIDDKPNPDFFPQCEVNGKTIYRRTVDRDGLLGIINTNGDTLLRDEKFATKYFPRCPTVYLDSFLIVYALSSRKVGLMNINGELVVDTLYNSIYPIKGISHLMNVTIDKKKKGVLDLRSKTVKTYGYDSAYILNSTTNITVKKDTLTGLLDMEGNEEIPPLYTYFVKLDSSYLYSKNDSILVYSTKKNKYSEYPFTLHRSTRAQSNHQDFDTYIVGKDEKYCLYDGKKLEYLTDLKYTKITTVKHFFECTNIIKDTTLFDPPKAVKNRKGKVIKIICQIPRNRNSFEYRDHSGRLIYGPVEYKLTHLNDIYFKDDHSSKDSVYFIDIRDFSVLPYSREDAQNPKNKKYRMAKHIIQSHSKQYIMNHFLDPKIDAIPYESLERFDDTGIYIYEKDELFGLLTENRIITQPIFERLEHRRGRSYLAKVDGKYGVLEVDED